MKLKFNYNWSSWNEIDSVLQSASDKEKGDLFELLSKYYFLYSFQYHNYYDNVWLSNEVPQKVLELLNLPKQDLGIDLIAKYGDEYHAIQCKYHGSTDSSVTRNEIKGFLSLYNGASPQLCQGFVCSTADRYSQKLNDIPTKPISYLLIDTWEGLSEDFFKTVRDAVNNKTFNPKPFLPRPHQSKAIKSAKKYFKNESRGKLIFPCGSGKSLTGYWITEALKSKRTLVAVPSLSLIKQTLEVYLREVFANNKKVKWLCICSDDGIGKGEDVLYKTNNIGVPCHTDRDYIKGWLKENSNEDIVVFTTYQSGKIISDLSTELNLSFDVGIYDEAHKTVGPKSKLFSHLLFDSNISVENRVFMTATQRFYSGSNEDIMSMDDIDIYGDVFAEMSFKEAIETEPQLLTDYKVVTIEVTKSEIASFIKENHLVSIDERWGTETESRSLASMIALRKAMNKLPIHNAVSFHSSIAKAKRCKEIQSYIDSRYSFEPIDTFTVSGKIPTTRRNQIVKEFANSDKSLITNSKCLTEGVDVPKIDCIVFSDPRKSQVDIVQALGRALRVKEGKEFGYVIIPVIYDEETDEIDNKNFSEIVSIVRGLSTNDRRIIDYFKMASETKKSEEFSNNDLFEVLSEYISEDGILNKIEIKIWEKLAKTEWLTFEQARSLIRKLNLKSAIEYKKYQYCNNLIPHKPDIVYKYKGWTNWSDFLGSINIKKQGNWIEYSAAKEILKTFNLKSQQDFQKLDYSTKREYNIPSNPYGYYKKSGEWKSWGDFLSNKNKQMINNYLPLKEAKKIISSYNIKSLDDYKRLAKTKDFPNSIYKDPYSYKKDKSWKGLGDFFSNGNVSPNLMSSKFLDYQSVKQIAKKNNIRRKEDWFLFSKSDKKPINVPSNPYHHFKKTGEWKSWGEFLETKSKYNNNRPFLDFFEARKYARSLNLTTYNDWRLLCKNDKLPLNIPRSPHIKYKDEGWKGYKDWLGTEEE